jgi:hypothetical protein
MTNLEEKREVLGEGDRVQTSLLVFLEALMTIE